MTKLLNVVIQHRYVEAGNVVVLELVSNEKRSLPIVQPGAHIDVHLPNHFIRQYSLCHQPLNNGVYRIAILNDPLSRGGSRIAFEQLKQGMTLKISSPKNLFPLQPAEHIVLVGGGIGITPLLSMAYELEQKGDSFELHYCSASPDQTPFFDEICNGVLADYTHFYFKSQGLNHRDILPQQFEKLKANSHIYTCGPQGFMQWVQALSLEKNIPEEHFHQEYFQVDIETSGNAFEVIAKRSNKKIMVQSEETILQALEREGIHIEMSCEQGVCGTCMCDVLKGEPDHRDVYLTEEEKHSNEQILVCCSRSKTPVLVLDV